MALKAIQTAIYGQLKADGTLMALIKGIFDNPPQDQAFPYITVGDFTMNPFNTFAKVGKDATATLHVWSRSPGFKEGMEILDRINIVLDGIALAVTGYSLVKCEFETATTLRDPDGATRHIAVGYRVIVQT